MGTQDLEFKQFLVQHADDLITAETGLQVEAWQPGETEPQPQPRERRLDRVFLTTGSGLRQFVHIEVQHTADRTMAHRLHEYGSRLMYSQHGVAQWLPVLSVALWPRKVPDIPEPPLRVAVAGGGEIVWPFLNIKIFEWTKAKLLSAAPGVLILAPLVPEVEVADLEIYAQRLYNGTTGTDREAAGVLFLTFVQERYRKRKHWPELRAQVVQMLRKVGFGMDVIDDMILNTDIVENAVELAELRGEIKALQTMWRKKFGAVPEGMKDALSGASGETLEDLIAQMVDPTFTLDQARAKLGL